MHGIWKDMFVLGLPVLEKILRPIIVYIFLIVGLRLSGKRELAQLNPFDLIVLLTLSNTVQNAIIGDDNSVTGGIIGAASLLAINYLVVRFLYDHRKNRTNCRRQLRHSGGRRKSLPAQTQERINHQGGACGCGAQAGIRDAFGSSSMHFGAGGTLTFIAKKPDTEDIRHQELLKKFDALTEELARLRKLQPPATA